MFRSILEMPGVVADYTVGTVIVLVQLTINGRRWSRVRHQQLS